MVYETGSEIMNDYIKQFTDQVTNLTKYIGTPHSEVQKIAIESFQEYFDAANTAYVKANNNFTTFIKITSPQEFSQFIDNCTQTAKKDASDFAEQTVNSLSELTAKYTSAIEQDAKTVLDVVNKAFNQMETKKAPTATKAPTEIESQKQPS